MSSRRTAIFDAPGGWRSSPLGWLGLKSAQAPAPRGEDAHVAGVSTRSFGPGHRRLCPSRLPSLSPTYKFPTHLLDKGIGLCFNDDSYRGLDMSNVLHIRPQSAIDLADRLASIAEEMKSPLEIELSVTAVPTPIALNQKCKLGDIRGGPFIAFTEILKDIPTVPALNGEVKVAAHKQYQAFHVTYKRQGDQAILDIPNPGDRDNANKLIHAIFKYFNVSFTAPTLGTATGDAERRAIEFKEKAVDDLKAEVTRLAGVLTQMAEKNVEVVRSLSVELENKYQERADKLNAQNENERMKITGEREAFEQDKARFDDRDRTHVRRDIFSKMDKNIEYRKKAGTNVGKPTSHGRAFVHVASWLMMGGAIAGLIAVGGKMLDPTKDGPVDWRLSPIIGGLSVVFGGTIIFYLRWLILQR